MDHTGEPSHDPSVRSVTGGILDTSKRLESIEGGGKNHLIVEEHGNIW